VEGQLRYAELRAHAEQVAVTEATLAAGVLELRFDPRTPVTPETLVRLVSERRGGAILPDGLRWPLAQDENALAGLGTLLDRLRADL